MAGNRIKNLDVKEINKKNGRSMEANSAAGGALYEHRYVPRAVHLLI